MDYLIKSMRLDAEVIAWLDKLKAMHGSYNKGLRHIAFSGNYGLLPKGITEAYRAPLLRPGEKKH